MAAVQQSRELAGTDKTTMEGYSEDEARKGTSSTPNSLNGSAIESASSEDESKSSLQKSVASYFDRLLQEEREKRKQEQEEQEMKKRLPILLTVTLPAWLGGEVNEIILPHDCMIDEVKQTIWRQVPALWDTSKDEYDLTLAGSYVLDVEFYKLLSIAVVKQYFAEHKSIALSVISKKGVPPRAMNKKKPEDTTRKTQEDKQLASQIAQKLSETQGKLYKVQVQLLELQKLYKKELEECHSNIELTKLLLQTHKDERRIRIRAQKQNQGGADEDDEDPDEADDEDDWDPETRLAHFEAELALKFFNDRKELLERIITNIQEALDDKGFTTPAIPRPALLPERQPSYTRLHRKDNDKGQGNPLSSSSSSLPHPAAPNDSSASSSASAGALPTAQPAMMRISELQESEALLRKSTSGMRTEDKEEMERNRKKTLTPLERIREEFVETEESYVAALRIIVKVYLLGMKEANLVNANDIEIIFSNVTTIHQIHEKLLSDISHVKDKDRAQTGKSFGDSLKAFIPFLKMYTVYINAFDEANKRISELMSTSKKFAAFLQECQARPESKKLDLPSYLIMPVQRLPRYELLLRDLIKQTPPEDSEHPKLSSLLEAVQSVNKHVNESKKNAELRQKLYKLQSSIKDKVDIFSRINRQLLKEGSLLSHELRSPEQTKEPPSSPHTSYHPNRGLDFNSIGVTIKKLPFKEHYFFLFDDFLLEVSLPSRSGKYKFIRKLELKSLTVSSWEKEKEREFKESLPQKPASAAAAAAVSDFLATELAGALIADEDDNLVIHLSETTPPAGMLSPGGMPTGPRRYLIKCKSSSEREEWLDILTKEVINCQQRPELRTSSSQGLTLAEVEEKERSLSSPPTPILSNLLGITASPVTATKEEKRKKPKKTKSKKGHKVLASSSPGMPSVTVTKKSKNDQDSDRPSLEITDLSSDDSPSVRSARDRAEGGAAEGESKKKDSLLPIPPGSGKEKKKGKREKSANDLGKKAEGEEAQGARRAKSLGPARAKAVLKEIITDAISRDDSVVQKSDSIIVSPREAGKEKKPGKRPGVAGSEETVGGKSKSWKEGKKKNKTATASSAIPKP